MSFTETLAKVVKLAQNYCETFGYDYFTFDEESNVRFVVRGVTAEVQPITLFHNEKKSDAGWEVDFYRQEAEAHGFGRSW